MVIIKKIDDLGRIAIPKDVRRSLRWMGGDEIEILPQEDGTVLLRSHSNNTAKQLELLKQEMDDPGAVERLQDLIEYLSTIE